jgi:type III secretory pathway component EscS
VFPRTFQGRSWQWTNKTVLHCFHHSTTFWLFLLVSNLPVAVKTGTLLNGGVHTIMYFYYADPTAFPKRWTPLITQGQILQLVTVTVLWIITPWVCDEYASFPAEHFPEYVTPQVMVPSYILMFLSFYFVRFKPESDKKQPGKKDKKGE